MFFIVNDHDRPCKRLLCVMTGAKLKYIDPGYESFGAMDDDEATPLEDFGFDVQRITGQQGRREQGGCFIKVQSHESGEVPKQRHTK